MRKLLFATTMSASILFTSCLGSYSAFNQLKDWNQDITDNKFVNNLVFWALNIVPVYGLFFFGDTVIFNVIEFWSGSNPIAMNADESETQVVEKDGSTLRMTATKNRMQIAIIDGHRKGEKVDLVYSPTNKSWSAIKPDGTVIPLASFEEGFYVVHMPNGNDVRLDPNQSVVQNKAIMNESIFQYNCALVVN